MRAILHSYYGMLIGSADRVSTEHPSLTAVRAAIPALAIALEEPDEIIQASEHYEVLYTDRGVVYVPRNKIEMAADISAADANYLLSTAPEHREREFLKLLQGEAK
jgi:hypothetical protein